MAVEASSLARQIELASNPPLHYERATDTSRSATDTGNTSTTGQLVLYIVRVPGSRDVFLTTLKPREKVVNAPDVQSSLYYLHVANQDANDSRTCVGERVVNAELQRRSWEQRHAAIRPVGQHVKSSSRENLPSMSLAHGSNGNMMTTRKPLPTPPDSPVEDQIGNFDQAPRVRRKAVKISTTSHERYVGRDESDDIALTLIRRDPASGTQWNVATIRNVLPGGCGDSIPVSGIKDEPELEVEVTNPGYSIFATSSGHDQSITPDHDSVFRRRVQNYRLDDTLHSHRGRGYNFVSPWNTRCVFSTGVSGGSLKCSHISTQDGTQASSISELRFNLPALGTRLLHSARTDTAHIKNENEHHSMIVKSRHRYTRSEPITYAKIDSAMHCNDYSLGRESAGGGIFGNRAKLGKLIIDDDGQQMLDLVVAANLGLWWRTYEKMTRR